MRHYLFGLHLMNKLVLANGAVRASMYSDFKEKLIGAVRVCLLILKTTQASSA